MDTVTSQRGSAKFILDGYMYVKQKNLAISAIFHLWQLVPQRAPILEL